MLADLQALAYLEVRQIVNRIRRLVRQPGRVAVYAVAICYFAAVAIFRAHGKSALPASWIAEPYASAIFFAYIVLLGVLMYGAASGIVGAFSSGADARFLTSSRISERLIVVWLQLRRSALTIVRMVLTLLLYSAFSGSGALRGIGLAIVGGALVNTASAVPMLKLRAIVGTRTAQSVAGAVAAIGMLPMAIVITSLVAPNLTPAARGIEHLGAGAAFNALFVGNRIALIGLYGFAALLVALSFGCGSGLIADLYSASMKTLEYRDRMRRGGGAAFTMEHTYERRGVNGLRFVFDSLRGPWTVAWKEWIAFARSASMQRLFALGILACGVGGAVFGSIAAQSSDPLLEAYMMANFTLPLFLVFVAMGSAIGLATDLRKPLWWMGPDPLWMRLFAWMAGTSWRLALCIAVGLAAWSIAMRAPLMVAVSAPLAIATVLYLRGVGLAVYAVFPSNIDQRGPLAMIRALLTYMIAAPPAIAGGFTVLFFHSAVAGIGTGVGVSLLETALLVCFASARIAGRGVAFAQAEAL